MSAFQHCALKEDAFEVQQLPLTQYCLEDDFHITSEDHTCRGLAVPVPKRKIMEMRRKKQQGSKITGWSKGSWETPASLHRKHPLASDRQPFGDKQSQCSTAISYTGQKR